MSEPTDAQDRVRIGVRIVFWDPDGDTRPVVIVDRDPDVADRRAALLMWERMSARPASGGDRRFLARHTPPSQWVDAADVRGWLDAVSMELAAPASWGDTVQLEGGANLVEERDVTVAVVHDRDRYWDEGPGILAGFDRHGVERDLAEMLVRRVLADPHLPTPAHLPDLADPVSVTAWLETAPVEIPGIIFTLHQASLPPTTVPPPAPQSPAMGPTVEGDAPEGETSRSVWVGAVYWDGMASATSPEFLLTDSRESIHRSVAQRIHTGLSDTRDNPDTAGFVSSHPYPVTSQEVSDFLATVAMAGPGTAFTCQEATIDATDVTRPVFLASLTGHDPFQATLMVDASLPRLRLKVASALADELADQPPSGAGREFLTRQGRPTYESAPAWLDAYRTQANHQVVGTGSTFLPATLTTPPALVDVRPPVPSNPVSPGPGQVLIDTRDPDMWAILNEGGIPDLLLRAFPPLPDTPATGDMDPDVTQEWMGLCLDVATDIARLPDLRDRLDELEYFHDRVARLLVRSPLPREPQPSDYLATHPAFEGEYDTAAYQWDHTHWQQQFLDTAVARDSYLTRLVVSTNPADAAPPTPQAPQPSQHPSGPPPRHGFPFTPAPPTPGGPTL